MSHAPPSPTSQHWVLLITVGLIWGASFMLMSVALRGFGPISIAAYRVTLAAVLLLALAFGTGKRLPAIRGPNAGRIWASAVGIGIFSNALPFFLLSWGQQYVASGFAGVTMAAVPLLVLPLAHVLVPGERLTWLKVTGFAFGFCGVLMLIGLGSLQSLGTNIEAVARLACLGAAGCYALSAIITKLCPPVSNMSLAAATLLCAAVLSLPVALLVEGVPQHLPLIPTLAILCLGVFATAIAKLIQVKVVREAGPSFWVLINYQVPVWSLVIGWAVLSEVLPTRFFIALALILFGMALSQWKVLRRLARAA